MSDRSSRSRDTATGGHRPPARADSQRGRAVARHAEPQHTGRAAAHHGGRPVGIRRHGVPPASRPPLSSSPAIPPTHPTPDPRHRRPLSPPLRVVGSSRHRDALFAPVRTSRRTHDGGTGHTRRPRQVGQRRADVAIVASGRRKTSAAVKRSTRLTPTHVASSLKRRASRAWASRVPWKAWPSISTTRPSARKRKSGRRLGYRPVLHHQQRQRRGGGDHPGHPGRGPRRAPDVQGIRHRLETPRTAGLSPVPRRTAGGDPGAGPPRAVAPHRLSRRPGSSPGPGRCP